MEKIVRKQIANTEQMKGEGLVRSEMKRDSD